MSASLAGAIKAYLETQGLGIGFHRDKAPTLQDGEPYPYPYGTINEGVSRTPSRQFNQYDDPEGHITELVDVHIWQAKKHADGFLAEDSSLPDRTELALRGARLTTAPFQVDGVRVVGSVRVPDPDANVVHDAITVAVDRVLSRS